MGQASQQSGSCHHGEVPPSPTSFAVVPDSGIHCGASHNPGGNRTRASQALSAPAVDRPTAVEQLPCVRRQHFRGKTFNFTRCSCARLVQRSAPTCLDRCLVCWSSARHVVPYIRSTQRQSDLASVAGPRASPPYATKFHGVMPATGACTSGVAPLSQGTGDRASSAARLSYGIIQATGACASGVALLSLGTGTRASSAPPKPRAAQ